MDRLLHHFALLKKKCICCGCLSKFRSLVTYERIPDADLATAVPDPMATPISAFFKAGASFTPSPVMAEISPSTWRYSTILLLCAGSTRENNLKTEHTNINHN